MNNKHRGILVSPLGLAPGAVSGVYFALQKEGFEIDKVITVGTSNTDVIRAAKRYLAPIFTHQGVDYDPIHIPADDLRGGSRQVRPYVAMTGLALEQAQREGEEVHIAVTAGRSGMGALAALATNLYGADYMWHFWVRADIEIEGQVENLRRLIRSEQMVKSKLLNPTVEAQAWEIVRLPFLDLRPIQDMLRSYAREGKLPPESPLARLFARADIKDFTEVFPAGLTMADADQLMKLKARYAEIEDPRKRASLMVDVGEILQRAGVVEPGEKEKLINLVNGNAAPEALVDFAKEAKDRVGFWMWIQQNKDSLDFILATTGFFLNALEIYLQFRGYI